MIISIPDKFFARWAVLVREKKIPFTAVVEGIFLGVRGRQTAD